jgi:cytochrome c biogenesis protein CcmG/thiol:disulfide interchange protein DsbE
VKRRPLIVLATIAVAAVVIVGLTQTSGGRTSAPKPLTAQEVRAGVAGAPAPLAAVHAEGDRLLGGGRKALVARIAALRGYPVVVNVWGSWCAPCRAEFPVFQRVAVRQARRVAFLGVATVDQKVNAARFLATVPVPYPSFLDFQGTIAKDHYGLLATPSTVFYDARGRQVTTHQGPYATAADLEADIRRYARGA